ncbi:unnamed protein product [Symbiodinium sp. CCMP2592]|nr:unnamed protein product [Symbiodinium sp. CCMP2592]
MFDEAYQSEYEYAEVSWAGGLRKAQLEEFARVVHGLSPCSWKRGHEQNGFIAGDNLLLGHGYEHEAEFKAYPVKESPRTKTWEEIARSAEEQKAHTARMKEETLDRQMEHIATLCPDTPITRNMGSILGEVLSDFLLGCEPLGARPAHERIVPVLHWRYLRGARIKHDPALPGDVPSRCVLYVALQCTTDVLPTLRADVHITIGSWQVLGRVHVSSLQYALDTALHLWGPLMVTLDPETETSQLTTKPEKDIQVHPRVSFDWSDVSWPVALERDFFMFAQQCKAAEAEEAKAAKAESKKRAQNILTILNQRFVKGAEQDIQKAEEEVNKTQGDESEKPVQTDIITPVVELLDLLNCGFMRAFWEGLTTNMCYRGMNGFRLIANSYVISGLLSLCIALLIIIPWKISRDNADKIAREGGGPVVQGSV